MSPDCPSRAAELADLLQAVEAQLIPFVQRADTTPSNASIDSVVTPIVTYIAPDKLQQLLELHLEDQGFGKKGVLEVLHRILGYSVNTWHQGFMDKLYSSTNAVGVASDLILSVLNTNLHVYKVSPALTVVEKLVSRRLAEEFGLREKFSGGITQPGGSASNATSLVIARNTLFPSTKVTGNHGHRLTIFTSTESHYSIVKAAMVCGLGTSNVKKVPTNGKGEMSVSQLELAIEKAKEEGCTPFYVNATAGTTVVGAFDPLEKIGDVCAKHRMWMHVDGSWGGSLIFSPTHREKLRGIHRADSITVNPHKMLGVPVTCSFLLGADMRKFHSANTLEAGYLFHEDDRNESDGCTWDLADLTLQCGRRGDSLKFALSWTYYGANKYAQWIDHGMEVAGFLAKLVQDSADFQLVGDYPPPCLQVCFYFRGAEGLSRDAIFNTHVTTSITKLLVAQGYMIDSAPGELGAFFRVVVHVQTTPETVRKLLNAIRWCQSLMTEPV